MSNSKPSQSGGAPLSFGSSRVVRTAAAAAAGANAAGSNAAVLHKGSAGDAATVSKEAFKQRLAQRSSQARAERGEEAPPAYGALLPERSLPSQQQERESRKRKPPSPREKDHAAIR